MRGSDEMMREKLFENRAEQYRKKKKQSCRETTNTNCEMREKYTRGEKDIFNPSEQ
jgi:hypothetical protein